MKLRIILSLALLLASGGFAQELLKKHVSSPLDAEADLSALEPWETPTEGVFIRSHHGVPSIDPEEYVLVVDGLVDHPLKISLKELKEFPEKSLHAVVECAGNWRGKQTPAAAGIQWGKGAVANAQWSGVSVAEILKKAGVKKEARFARFEGADKPLLPTVPPFVRSIPLSKLERSDSLLAWTMNRQPLALVHGAPLRLILPGWYGQNWLKWVTHITLTAEEDAGFYMKKGYRMPKTPLKPDAKWDSATGNVIEEILVQSLMVTPRPSAVVGLGQVAVSGKAFSGSGTISKVEISTNEGKSWVTAKLEAPRPTGGWQSFELSVPTKKPGKMVLLSRATDSKGNVQPLVHQWNPSGYLRNAVDRVEVHVVTKVAQDASALVQEKCLICHSSEMLQSQQLSEAAWDKVITKMKGWGAVVGEEEQKLLIKYLAQVSLQPKPTVPMTDFNLETELLTREEKVSGSISKGRELYSANCLACHGENGEGKTGPRLMGRAIPKGHFSFVVINGLRTMPSYGDALKKQDIADIRSYLQK